MKNFKAQDKGHAQLFQNPILEIFTKSNPILIWCMYLAIIAYFLNYSVVHYSYGFKVMFIVFSAGLKCWSLFEYLMHRFVFHWISSNPLLEKTTYLLHGNHHHFPRDKQRLFMPPLPSLLMSSSLFGITYLLAGSYAFLFFPGFILGHLFQASLHYAIHAGPPPFKWLKPLWRNHHLHHYTNEEKGFGITSTIWDHLFGTAFNQKKYKEDGAKVKALMFEKPGNSNTGITATAN
jgi:sterol desaturase/sphingolipid hydroxylase (fatty acid hydroxylase superfamily)